MYLGDFAVGSTIDFKFCTVDTVGAPTTLAGSPAMSVYKGNGITESTAGITLTTDFDSRTGMHHVRITTSSDAAFYATGNDFQAVITVGTVGGTSVVGYIVAAFSLGNRSAATPAQVNTEVLDVLNVDTFAEPGQEDPPATTTLIKKFGWLYKAFRNKVVQSSTLSEIYNDAGTVVDAKSTTSDTGLVFSRGKFTSGP